MWIRGEKGTEIRKGEKGLELQRVFYQIYKGASAIHTSVSELLIQNLNNEYTKLKLQFINSP